MRARTDLCRGDLDDADAGVARLAGADAVLQVSEPLMAKMCQDFLFVPLAGRAARKEKPGSERAGRTDLIMGFHRSLMFCSSLTTLAVPETEAQSVLVGSEKATLTWASFSSSSNLPAVRHQRRATPSAQTNLIDPVKTGNGSGHAQSVLAMNWKTRPLWEAGAMAREWSWPSAERVTSMPNLASLMILRISSILVGRVVC